jgi:hypothetical protein
LVEKKSLEAHQKMWVRSTKDQAMLPHFCKSGVSLLQLAAVAQEEQVDEIDFCHAVSVSSRLLFRARAMMSSLKKLWMFVSDAGPPSGSPVG